MSQLENFFPQNVLNAGVEKGLKLTPYRQGNSGNAPEALAEVQRNWLVKLRTDKGLAQAVNLAGPFIMSSQGNREGIPGRQNAVNIAAASPR